MFSSYGTTKLGESNLFRSGRASTVEWSSVRFSVENFFLIRLLGKDGWKGRSWGRVGYRRLGNESASCRAFSYWVHRRNWLISFIICFGRSQSWLFWKLFELRRRRRLSCFSWLKRWQRRYDKWFDSWSGKQRARERNCLKQWLDMAFSRWNPRKRLSRNVFQQTTAWHRKPTSSWRDRILEALLSRGRNWSHTLLYEQEDAWKEESSLWYPLPIERPRVHPTGRILPVGWLDIAPITPKSICWGYQNFFFQFNAGISTAFFAKFCSDVRRNTYCECWTVPFLLVMRIILRKLNLLWGVNVHCLWLSFLDKVKTKGPKRDTCIYRWQRKFQSLRSSDLMNTDCAC